ncbi:MAG: DUF309 domain-containing protein [Gammaproteobacteria bacterium]|nr:DUF309 domain-containing protein [Gammaproteobacteria bacterium]MCW8840599.1 DUF309 domain-containing protein [Gammaproteobacteria bacterium]MCW8928404.1 DUF309 domain-containing protein [Gammaproteobacteria bacterium]MCW8957701.1 DUF309 domain-containing protein [Gammaproteobacteria bacterium]MCW8972430.1 DUF309 domain-containing protein [Gammaproteobacteria bacterium]
MSLLLWDELTVLWQSGDFRGVHDWINERWSRTVQESPQGDADPFARFLQGMAFAALAFHFAEEQNGESAAIFVEDGLDTLSRFPPSYAGVELSPIVDALAELRHNLPSADSGLPIPPVVSGVRALRFAGRVVQ